MKKSKNTSEGSGLDAIERMLYGNVEDDAELEAELLALQNEIDRDDEGHPDVVSTSIPKVASASSYNKRKEKEPSMLGEIDMLSHQMSEEVNVADDENDESVDLDDDLLNELDSLISGGGVKSPKLSDASQKLCLSSSQSNAKSDESIIESPVDACATPDLGKILQERLENYMKAKEAAQNANDESRLRRIERGIQTLSQQVQRHKSGRAIATEDIPPTVIIPKSIASTVAALSIHANTDTVVARQEEEHLVIPDNDVNSDHIPETSAQPADQTKQETLNMLENRRDEFKKAALVSKHSGDTDLALKCLKICKQFDQIIDAFKTGQPVDLSDMPDSPGSLVVASATLAPPIESEKFDTTTLSSSSVPTVVLASDKQSIVEALEKRMEKYKDTALKAQQEEDGSKFRRMTRIQKQYEEALRDVKAGRKVDFSELPTPPGFPPLPVGPGADRDAVRTTASDPAIAAKRPGVPIDPTGARNSAAAPIAASKKSRQEQQLEFLLDRQRQFKTAALEAKQRGDLAAAKNYLRNALGVEKMIQVSRSGLPVDVSNVPVPPGLLKAQPNTLKPSVSALKTYSDLALDKAYGIHAEADSLVRQNREETYGSLEADLIRQVQLCDYNRDYFTKLGDVAKIRQYEHLGNQSKKELDSLRNGFKHGDPVPRFHYETKTFPVLQCCPDLRQDDLEIHIIRGLLLKLPAGYEPKDADVFVKYEFAFPKDTPQTGKTASVRGTNSPTYEFSTKLNVNLKSRQFLLMIKRHGVKFEIYQRGSLFRSDKLIGACEMKLQSLENKAEIHESLDVMEGRRPAGGKLEVKVRIREPLLHKTTQEMAEKWLVVDEFIRLPKGHTAKQRLPPIS